MQSAQLALSAAQGVFESEGEALATIQNCKLRAGSWDDLAYPLNCRAGVGHWTIVIATAAR